ncbi:MAG: cell wall-binding protein [Clostridiaceae bacterium]|nr:cell wall-binding protein [Clostridiaceae bacterium]
MKKRLISILILVTMLFALLPAEAIAVLADNSNPEVNTVQEEMKPGNPFADVREGSWYYDAVQYARINGFFNGTSENLFEPDGTMSRGMFVTVLGRMAGVESSTYTEQSDFSDVPADAWYAPFVAWASKHGITTGIGNGQFDPNGLINREQMAVFFVRYFEAFGVDYDTGANITTVPADLDIVSPWAREMVLKLWKTGLLAGDGVSFDPTGSASRAQAATLCMRTDKAVETWYREPGIPSDRVSANPNTEQKPETSESSTGGDSGDGSNTGSYGSGTGTSGSEGGSNADDSDGGSNTGSPGSGTGTGGSEGGSNTTYYKVTFVIGSSREEKMYQKGTLLNNLPIPAQPTGKVFLGWYYDTGKSKRVNSDDRLNANTTLYAQFTDAVGLEQGGTPNFVSALEQAPDFSISMKKTDSAPILGTDFKFRNITAPDKTPETEVANEDIANIERVRVEGSNGVWIISSASGGFTPGHTYQIELIDDDMTFDDSTAAIVDFIAAHGQDNVAEVRFFNFSIEKDGTLNLKLNDDIKYIAAGSLNSREAVGLMKYAGLYLASTDNQGLATYTENDGSGSFTYTGSDIQVGDTVSVYSGTKPTERQPEKGTTSKTENDDVSYVKITRIDGSTYYYVAAEAEDVLFTPDVLPIDVDAGDGTSGWAVDGTLVVIDNDKLTFADGYELMGLSNQTTVDVGDYLAFYTGDFGEDDAQDQAYGEIITITVNGDTTTITYTTVSEEQVLSAMDMYDETQLTEDELQAAIDENMDGIQEIIEAQLVQSNFIDDAGEYLAGLALQTDEVRSVFGDGMTLSDCIITYADSAPPSAGDLTLMGNIIDNEQDGKKPKISVSISPRLSHFDPNLGGTGLRVEVTVNYTFRIQKSGSNTAMEVNLTAFFEQEVTIGFSVSGGAVWKWKWIFPYIADFRMNGNLDLGTYTGIGITATAKLTEDKEPWGMPWPSSVKEAAANRKIFSLSESIKKKMEEVETILPKTEATASGGLAEKYAAFMEDANEDWVDLIIVNLIDLRGAVDPFHILAYGLQVDFVVSANLNVALGMTFQYENFKRHSFTLSVKKKKAESDTVDLSTNGYQFDFYVMGSIGIRAGIRAKATVGLFSTKLAGIGLQIEAGAYARLWGYFYYHLENWKIAGKWQKKSSYSGAVLIEVGVYLDVRFIAEALNGKYSYAPTIYAKEWPFWSAGQQENVYDFAYKDDPTYSIVNVNTYTMPGVVYDMLWMDLKTGEMETEGEANTKNFDSNTATGSDDELRFAVELSNPNFTYDPVTNRIDIGNESGEATQTCEMKITWKEAPLSGSSEVLSRTITLNWSTDINRSVIAFESNGGSAVEMLVMLAGADISNRMPANPTRTGYIFDGWYTDRACLNAFTATNMPEGDTSLFAKWVPDLVPYTVEHYQKELDGTFVLQKTDRLRCYTGDLTNAAPQSYTGFTVQTFKQQIIAPDGSTRIAINYDRNCYELKFVYSDSEDVTIKMPYGSTIINPSNPYKQGYTFIGWDKSVRETMPDDALTYTARWKPSTDTNYTVKHYLENLDGTYTLDFSEGKIGTTETRTNATVRIYTGFTVENPVTQNTILPDGSTVVEIYYERNSHLLTWDFNGGEALSGTYTNGNTKYGTIIMPPTPIRSGYSLEGWYKDPLLTRRLDYSETTMPDAPMTLYAKWVEGQTTYRIKHIRQAVDGTFPESGDLVETHTMYGKTGDLTKATAKSYTGYRAPIVSNAFIKADGSTVVSVYYYSITYTVYFDGNGCDDGNMPSQTFMYWETTPLNANQYTKANYAFAGWNTIRYGGGRSYVDGESFSEVRGMAQMNTTFTLYAQWRFDNCIVSFDSNPGSGSTVPTTAESVQVPYGGTYGPLPEVSRPGYTFNGWFAEKSCLTLVTSAAKVTSTSNHTLYAKWTPITYTVNFNANLGSGTMQAQMFGYDGSPTALTANTFTRTGYTFTGWNTKADGSGIPYADGASVKNLTSTANGVVPLYAQWAANTYSVSFNGNGSTAGFMENQIVLYDETRNLTASAFEKTFYTFNGWNTKADGSGIPYSDEEAVKNLTDAAEVILYAQWTLSAYTVEFDSNKGSGSSYPSTAESIYVAYSGVDGTLPTVNREGYTFDGWFMLNSDTPVLSTDTVEADHTLYAHWTANTYTVEFSPNGGSGTMQAQTFTYDAAQNLPVNGFTKGSDPFVGWNTKANGGGIQYGDEALVRNLTDELNGSVTLYALWGDNSAAQIGSNRYDTLQAAINAVSDGQTIQMLRDATERIQIPESNSTSFTLDLNGKMLNDRDGLYTIYHQGRGKLTITDTAGGGKITSADSYGTMRGTITLTSLGTSSGLEIQGGTIENTHEWGTAILNTGRGNINIYSGTVCSTGTAIKNTNSGNVNISDGSVTGTTGIDNASSGNINVSGGTVYGDSYAITIGTESTGTITISGTATIDSAPTANLATTVCGTIKLWSNGATLEIIGGTVKSTVGVAIYNEGKSQILISGNAVVTSGNPPEGRGTIYLADGGYGLQITGGTVENTHENGIAIYEEQSPSVVKLSGSTVIKGGGMAMNRVPHVTWYPLEQITASTDVSGMPTVPYAEAYIITYKYLKLDQHLSDTYIAKIEATGTEYVTLQTAFDEVADGQTIQLLDDITLAETITIASDVYKSFTFDLNDYILVGRPSINSIISHSGSGELTITDDSANEGGKIINSAASGYVIYLNGGSLVVAGGAVQNYASDDAIKNIGSGSITISGGVVLGVDPNTLYNNSNGSLEDN